MRLAKELISEALTEEDRILKDPEPVIMLLELADSSVNIAVHPWVNSADYWDVSAAILENAKAKFDAKGVSILYPQRGVHLYQVT